MKKSIIFLSVILLSAFQPTSNAQHLTYTALLNGVVNYESKELQGYLMSNGWTFIESSINSIGDYEENEDWAYGYISDTKKASIWLHIYSNIFGKGILVTSFGDDTHAYLSKKIEEYCEYLGVVNIIPESADWKEYRKKYYHNMTGTFFYIYSKKGSDYIRVEIDNQTKQP